MKNTFIVILSFCFLLPAVAGPRPKLAKLRYPVEFLFEQVLKMKKQELRPEIPFPQIHYESKISLKFFQDMIESQWQMRPDVITNAFAVESNLIFLIDEDKFYRRTNRCMDDSLVHELVHYVQVKYQKWDVHDESLEWEAVDIQTRFREEFCK
jgi:hypothetical protein